MASARILKEGLIGAVGKRDRARLWSDIMVEGSSLKEAFPRIFVLAEDKEGCVFKFGKRDGVVWKWEVVLRRNLFDWEINQWNCFMGCLMCIKVMDAVEDSISWAISKTIYIYIYMGIPRNYLLPRLNYMYK